MKYNSKYDVNTETTQIIYSTVFRILKYLNAKMRPSDEIQP